MGPGERSLSAAPPARPRRERARLVVILGALSAFGPLSIDMYLPGLPALGATLEAPAWAVQLTLTACLAGLALGQIVAGPLSDRFGRRRPLLLGVGAYAAASALCALAPSIAVRTANTPRHEVTVSTWPPSTGARIGASPLMSMSSEKKRAAAAPECVSRTIARATTISAAPCTKRRTTSTTIDGASAHSSDAAA